jgi:DNA-binding SARP family transcriptional activator
VANQIANYISGLRQALRPAGDLIRLTARQPGFVAEVEPELIDAHRFSTLVVQARTALDGHEPEVATARLRDALGLWRGTPLEGLDTEYLVQRRTSLEAERRAAVELLARVELDAGNAGRAAELLSDLVSADPANEPLATLRIRALTKVGDGAGAAALAVRTIRTLHGEGREPGPGLKQAQTDALAGRTGEAPARPVGPRNQLPPDSGAFTGREPELDRLLKLADTAGDAGSPGTVVISAIDGMGGIGKTAATTRSGLRAPP